MEKEWAKVRKDLVEPRLTCPLCNNLLKEATANTECIHTFCRNCIYIMIEEEEIEWCPVCEVDWGIDPFEKMRPDNSLQSLRNKLFPLKDKTVKAPEVSPSVPSPAGRKDKSPSVVSTPRVARGLKASSFSLEKPKPIENEEELLEDSQDGSSSPDTSNKSAKNTEQLGEKIKRFSLRSSYMSMFPCEGSQCTHNKGKKNGAEPKEARLDTWKPLNSLVEVARRSTSFRPNVQGIRIEPLKVNVSDSQVQKAKKKENRGKEKVQHEKIRSDHVSLDTAKANKLRRPRWRKEPLYGESSLFPQDVLDTTNTKPLRIDSIWFTLVASDYQDGEPLPQIPSPYIRIQDGSVPVSFIQKFLKKKLNLESEDEIEMKCMGKSVHPVMEVGELLESWLETVSTGQRITATIGSSAKDFVMVLTYSRKVLNP